MASAVVDEALQGLELLGRNLAANYPLKELQIGLRQVRTFLLFARKWPNDVCSKSDVDTSTSSSSLMMESFLKSLEESLIQNGKSFHNLCLAQKNKVGSKLWKTSGLFKRACILNNCIDSFRQKFADSYVILSEYYQLQSKDQSLGFIDSLQQNLADMKYQYPLDEAPVEVESLQEKLLFFKNFIRFAQLRGFEPLKLQILFTHLQLVAVNAASLCHEWSLIPYDDRNMFWDEFHLKFSELFQKIKPADPQIRAIYVQVLMGLKDSGSSHALTLGMDRYVLGDFVDSLLYNILEALTYEDSYIISLKEQLPMLYEGLIFLRTILTNHLEKIDELHEKVKDLVGAVVNKAAIVICSLLVHELQEGLAKEMEVALSDFLEKIKLIKVVTSSFSSPETSEHGFVDFFLENLKELPFCKADSIAYAKDQIQTVQEDLASLRLSFLESNLDQHGQDGKLLSLWSSVVELTYKTRSVIESLVVGDIPNCSAMKFNFIKDEIDVINKKVYATTPSTLQGGTPTINKKDEADKIIGEIMGGKRKRDIISIVGMPGIGKTTLAKSVYDHISIINRFYVRAWCVVSHVYEKKDLLLQILDSVDRECSGDDHSIMNECELEEKLKKCLLKRRYLIVLDDVWDNNAWSDLERSFPDDNNSSRILLTSRHSDVAKEINSDPEPHPLRLLTDEESCHLLQEKLSCKKSYPLDLKMKIAKNCKGLPLTIVIVAGILANLEEDGWKSIAEKLSLSDLPILDQCMDMLEVSYKLLPENLRSCFFYFGAFRADEEIPCKRLIWLWKAEGFVKKCGTKSLEEVAKDYMNDLIFRNLVTVSKKRSVGGAKTCHVHDLLHEFCVVKAKKEKFLSILSQHDEFFNFQGQHDLQRLCVNSTSKDFEKSGLFCPKVRSLLFAGDGSYHFKHHHISFIFHFFKLLQVLDLTNIHLNSTFPSEIALLVELRYLAIRGHMISIPPVIADLSHLETLLVYAHIVYLPDSIWNLPELRVLQSYGRTFLNSDSVPTSLHNLDTFSTLWVSYRQLEKIMRKLQNIRILKCNLSVKSGESNSDCKSIVVMDQLSKLEALHLNLRRMEMRHIKFCFPSDIKKLTVSCYHSSIIPRKEGLLNLVVLKLYKIDFEGNTWDMNEEWKFPKLRLLEMESLEIVKWAGSDDVEHFPSLENLVVQGCKKLKDVPSCLGEIPTLEMIEVRYCGNFVASLFQDIKEKQDYWGNEVKLLMENSGE